MSNSSEQNAVYRPEIYAEFRRDFPEITAGYDQLGSALHNAGPLDTKTRRLVKLAAAVGAEAEGAVRSHVRKGLEEGLTRQEIEHAIVLNLTTIGFASMIASLKWAREVFVAQSS